MVAVLNDYFTEMVEILFEHRGTLMSFVGDALLAVFGLPNRHRDDAERALVAAIAMRDRLAWLNANNVFDVVGGLQMGVALHTGRVVTASIGAPERLEYTVIGDAVNTVVRLEEATKALSTEVLISATSAAQVGPDHALTSCGTLQLRGRRDVLDVYMIEGSDAWAELSGAIH